MATLVVKSYLERSDLSVETRRFGIDEGKINNGGIFKLVHGSIENIYPDLKKGKRFSLFWKDIDADFVTMSTDEEMRDALSNTQNGICKIYIRVNENEDTETTGGDQNTAINEDESPVKGDHEKADPWQVAIHLLPSHPHPIPPHPFPFQGWRGRGGRHHGGFFGHHPDHHPHFHGFHPHFHGHHGGHHGHHGHGHRHGQWGKRHGHDGKQAWKDALRNSVPMPHRRWAKGFIQSWRKDNMKNATTTTDSDCNSDGKVTLANAGVPPAYEEWLKLKLVHWHLKWCSEEMNGERANKKHLKKLKKTLKASVPGEFRKWTKWYLNSHFCIRESPKFKRGFNEHNWTHKGSMKKHVLSAEVPKEYRAWTKQFVRDWRIEKKLDEPNSAISLSSDSEGFEMDMDFPGVGPMPEAYKQWLEIFLLRWHTWRSQLERNPGQSLRGGMHQFQDTVPMEFRAWVKHYMCMHYSKNKKSACDPFQGQYQKIMQTFQKKWIHNQQNLDEENSSQSSSSSSEDEISAKKDENEKGEPEASFGRLSLKNDAPQKSKEQAKSDFPMNFGFRQWAKQALVEWDGQTVIDVDGGQQGEKEGEDVPLPPHIYRWMSKFMMRMHKKKMKHMFKAAKREMKAAKKFRKSK